jgi:hypothetical protein
MAEGKSKKIVKVQVPDDISVDLVASAIRARGSDDGGVKVCSVKKIKDYILGRILSLFKVYTNEIHVFCFV